MDYSKVALVLWDPDYEELNGKLRNNCDMQLCDVFEQTGVLETADERYVCLYSDWGRWDEFSPEIKFILNFIKDVRHTFIQISENFTVPPTVDRKTWDDRGSDEEFDEFLGYYASISGLEEFSGLEVA